MDVLWSELSLGQKSSVMQTDPTLRYFDQSTVETVALGGTPNFTVEKVIEVQDRIKVLAPSADVTTLKAILDGVKPRVRQHKLTRVIVDRLTILSANPEAIDTSAPPPSYTSYANQDQIPEPISATTSPTHQQQLPQDGSPQRPAIVRQAPANVQRVQMQMLLNPDLDDNAVVNVRAAPDSTAEAIGTITHQTGPVAVCAFQGAWAKLDGSPGGEEAWILRLLPEGSPVKELFVTFHENENDNEPMQTPATSRPTTPNLPVPTVSHIPAPMMQAPMTTVAAIPFSTAVPLSPAPVAQLQARPLTSGVGGDYVSRVEYDALRERVMKLEEELHRLTLVLRRV